MYELEKIGKVFTSKFVGTGPSYLKKKLPGHGLTKVEKRWSRHLEVGRDERTLFPIITQTTFFFFFPRGATAPRGCQSLTPRLHAFTQTHNNK
jgi:hypothetical protein